MKWFDAHIGSADTALQQAPEVFQSVGMNGSVYVCDRMIDDLVGVFSGQTFVRKQLVGIQSGASFYPLLDFLLHNLLATILNDNGLDFSAALDESDNCSFAFAASSGYSAPSLRDMHVPRFSAYESFVYFNVAPNFHDAAILQRKPDAVIHEPCGSLHDAEIASEFVAADSV